MFSLIPILLLTVFLLNTMRYILYDSVEKTGAQEKFNMLTVIADYVVKDAGAYGEGDAVYPNLIEPAQLNGLGAQLGPPAGMENIFIGLESEGRPPADAGTCIYRIVVNRVTREIDRLFVCG